MRNPVDIVEELVSRIDGTITAKSITDNLDGTFTIKTCNAKYATPAILLNGLSIVSVTDFDTYYEVVVSSDTLPVEPFVLSPPKYYEGTAIDANQQIINLQSGNTESYPMIYFPASLRSIKQPEFVPESNSQCRLVFAVGADRSWDASAKKNIGINPMLQLWIELRNVIKSDATVRISSDASIIPYYILGDMIEGKGTIFNAINDNCSGVVVDFDLEALEIFRCKC